MQNTPSLDALRETKFYLIIKAIGLIILGIIGFIIISFLYVCSFALMGAYGPSFLKMIIFDKNGTTPLNCELSFNVYSNELATCAL